MSKRKYESDKPSCVVCGPDSENRNILFRFPKSPDRQASWKSFAKIQSLKRRSRLCELHFSKEQLVHKRLKKDALPSLNPTAITKDAENSAGPPKLVKILPKPRLPLMQLFSNNQTSAIHSDVDPSNSVIIQPHQNITYSPTANPNLCEIVFPQRPLASSPIVHASFCLDDKTVQLQTYQNAQEPGAQISGGKPTAFEEKCHDHDTKKNGMHDDCRKRIKKLRYNLCQARSKIKGLTDLQKLFSDNPLFLNFLNIQVERAKVKRKFYTSFEKSMALSLFYACGRNGYRLLTDLGIKLPTTRALRKWMECFNCTPGKNDELLLAIQHLTANYSSHDRDCIITWDEMSIKQLIEYNRSTDNLEGIVDLGNGTSRKTLEPANEVLVFMIQGINTKWKFPISFYFSSNATKASDLEKLVEDNISKVNSINLRVRVCICDQAFTNQSLYRKWDIYSEGPGRYFGQNKVYCIHDTPHLIKLVRNNLLKYDFYIEKRVGNHIRSDRIRWLHLGTFFNKDRRLTTRMAPRLTKCHIILKDFSKMKVRLATQLFSSSVYAGMMTMIKLGIMKVDAMPTANFVNQIDDMFDLLNISKYSQDKPSRCAKNLFENFYRFDKHINLIKSLKIPRYPHEPMFLKGLEITLQGIKSLCMDLKADGYSHVYTRQIQQDCLENFFSAVRMKGGFCRNPTARQFRINFKYLFLAKLLKNPGTGNTEGSHHQLAKVLEIVGTISVPENNVASVVSDNSDSVQQVLFRKKSKRKLKLGIQQEASVMSYFGPACVVNVNNKNHCKSCENMLCKMGSINDTMLTHFKQENELKNLSTLNESTDKVFSILNRKFDEFFYLALNNCSDNICTEISKLFCGEPIINTWISDKCKLHKLEILSYFIRTKLYRILKDKNEDFRQVKSWNQSRRDQRDQ